MQTFVKPLIVAALLAAPVTVQAQSGNLELVSFEQLEEKDRRRLDFYAEKLVIELMATVEANRSGDVPAFNKHGAAMKQTAGRLLESGEKVGLAESDIDLIFHRHLISDYVGPLPDFMVTDSGPAGTRALVSLMVAPNGAEQGDYVDSIRDAGSELFSD